MGKDPITSPDSSHLYCHPKPVPLSNEPHSLSSHVIQLPSIYCFSDWSTHDSSVCFPPSLLDSHKTKSSDLMTLGETNRLSKVLKSPNIFHIYANSSPNLTDKDAPGTPQQMLKECAGSGPLTRNKPTLRTFEKHAFTPGLYLKPQLGGLGAFLPVYPNLLFTQLK